MPDKLIGSSVTSGCGAGAVLFEAGAGDGKLVDFFVAAAKRRGVSGRMSMRGVAGTPCDPLSAWESGRFAYLQTERAARGGHVRERPSLKMHNRQKSNRTGRGSFVHSATLSHLHMHTRDTRSHVVKVVDLAVPFLCKDEVCALNSKQPTDRR